MTAFPRSSAMQGAPALDGKRIVLSLGHVIGPLLTHGVLYHGVGGTITKQYLNHCYLQIFLL